MQNQYRVFSASHIGQRNENQDAFAVLTHSKCDELLCVVADGMGGHEGGAFAAKKVVETCKVKWEESESVIDPDTFLNELAFCAHEAVIDSGNAKFDQAQSLVSVLYIHLEKSIYVSMHVGDCRTIQFANKNFIKRTIDQSLAQLHALKGDISDDEIASHPDQNKIYSSIGGSEPPSPIIEHYSPDGDTFLICSDGFWELFNQHALGVAIEKIESAEALEELIEQQVSGKTHHDNTTAIIVKLPPSEDSSSMFVPPSLAAGHQESEVEGSLRTEGALPAESSLSAESSKPAEGALSAEGSKPAEGALSAEGSTSSNDKNTSTKLTTYHYKFLLGLGSIIFVIALTYYFLSSTDSTHDLPEPLPTSGKTSPSKQSSEQPSGQAPDQKPEQTSEQNKTTPSEPQGKSSKEAIGTQASTGESGNIETRRQTPNIPILNIDDAIEKTEDVIRQKGGLGENDTLKVTTRGNVIGNSQVIKFQQFYKDLPVYGAQTITLVRDGKIANIDSKTLNDIDIDISPALSAKEAVILAENEIGTRLNVLEAPQLIIFKKEDSYLLIWRAEVEKASGERVMLFLDSTNALIVEEISLHISGGQEEISFEDITSEDEASENEKD